VSPQGAMAECGIVSVQSWLEFASQHMAGKLRSRAVRIAKEHVAPTSVPKVVSSWGVASPRGKLATRLVNSPWLEEVTRAPHSTLIDCTN
jgi:hypothetical protein